MEMLELLKNQERVLLSIPLAKPILQYHQILKCAGRSQVHRRRRDLYACEKNNNDFFISVNSKLFRFRDSLRGV